MIGVFLTVFVFLLAHGTIASRFDLGPAFAQTWPGGAIADSVLAPLFTAAWTVMYFRLTERQPEAVTT